VVEKIDFSPVVAQVRLCACVCMCACVCVCVRARLGSFHDVVRAPCVRVRITMGCACVAVHACRDRKAPARVREVRRGGGY
jgi:hypothetical protein